MVILFVLCTFFFIMERTVAFIGEDSLSMIINWQIVALGFELRSNLTVKSYRLSAHLSVITALALRRKVILTSLSFVVWFVNYIYSLKLRRAGSCRACPGMFTPKYLYDSLGSWTKNILLNSAVKLCLICVHKKIKVEQLCLS